VGARRNSRPFQVKVLRTEKQYYQKSTLRDCLEALWKEARAQHNKEDPDDVYIDSDLLNAIIIDLLIDSGGEEYCGSIDDDDGAGYSSSIALLHAKDPAKVFNAAVEFLEAQFLPEGEVPVKKSESTSAEPVDPLAELLAMTLTDRIKAVAKDVRSRKDKYAGIAAHELADALEVPDSERPTPDDWRMGCYVETVSIEEHTKVFDSPSEIIYRLEGKVSDERFEELKVKSDQVEAGTRKTFRFLTNEERDIAESSINEEQLLRTMENGLGGIAMYRLEQDGVELDFEGRIEDDGSCIILWTPYEGRDGKFIDLENCVTEWCI
jgi:hypothetical protein